MPNIDDKVVAMSFENRKFESGVKTTLDSLDKLKNSLQFPNAGKGLDNINAAAKRVNLDHISRSVDEIQSKLGYLSVAALAIFANIAAKAVQAGAQMVKAFTIGPIIAGFQEYAVNLNSIQTILSNTRASGADLQDVNDALLELNKYSDKTIYNFAEMARNIGTFTAAGVALKPATAAIKGIANLAAMSGSNSQQAATAMYQLSQAISAGRVSLMDWNSVVNAGMGGTVFQRALAQTAVAMGELPKSALKLVGPMKNVSIHGQSFRQSMMAAPGKESWLTSDVLTKTLSQFTGDMTDAELAAEGFNEAQIKAIQAQAKVAMEAATQVKTFQQVIEVAKETAGSGWAQTWQLIFGDFGEAKKTFTALSNAINGFINASANARNKVLKDWKALGGRTVLIEALKTSWRDLASVIKPIKDAFRDIFPRRTGKELYNMTVSFRNFAKELKPSQQTIENIRRTFRGLFAILDIGKQIIGGIFGVFAQLFNAAGVGDGVFLGLTANIGDFFVALDKALKSGTGLRDFFDGLGTLLAIPVRLFGQLAEAISNLFSGFSPGGFSVQIDGANKVAGVFKSTVESVAKGLEGLGPAINNAVSHMNFEAILTVINTGLFAALVLTIRKFIGGSTLQKALGGFGNAIARGLGKNVGGFAKLGGVFGSMTGSLKAMQSNLKAKTLKEIAIAIALLSASVLALSFVNPKRLNASLGAMAIMFGELIGALMILDKVLKTTGALKLTLISAALIGLATAIDLLVIAVFTLSKLSWSELTKGLGGIVVLLGALSGASIILSKNASGMIRAGVAIGVIAVALNIMALAVKQFGSMDLASLAKGLGGVAGSLVAIAGAMKIMPRQMILQSAALIAIATALNILVKAVAKFGAMNLVTIGKGLLGIGGGLVVIAGAMHLMPKHMVLTAAGLLLVATSLGKIVSAVQNVSTMSLLELGKGIAGLAAALGILAIGLRAMKGTFGGSAALVVAATGVSLLVPALVSLGRQSWASIIKSLTALGAGFTVLSLAARLLAPSVPALIAFGAALVLIGGGLALAGAGVALIGVGLSSIAVAGPVAIDILIQALIDLSKAIPKMAKNFVLGLLEIVKAFAKTAPKFVNAMVKIIDSLAEAIIKSAPKIAEALVVVVQSALESLAKHAPEIVQAGFDILMALLKGINDNIAQITTMAVTIIVNFVNSLARNLNRIVSAGFNFVIKLVQGIMNNIGKVITAGADIIIGFVQGITNNMTRIVTKGTEAIANFILGLGNATNDLLLAGGKAIAQFLQGVANSTKIILKGAADAARTFVNALVSTLLTLERVFFNGFIRFLNGTAVIIENNMPKVIAAMRRVGEAIIKGIIMGITHPSGKSLKDAILDTINPIPDWAMKAVKGGSPAKVMIPIGKSLVLGIAKGLDDNISTVRTSVLGIGNSVINAFNDVFQTASPSKVMEEIGRYVGKGFADGLVGSQSDVKNAFETLGNMLSTDLSEIRKRIVEEKAKLKKLQENPQANAKEIKAAQNALKQDQAILTKLSSANKVLIASHKEEQKELLGLSKKYDVIGNKLEAAKQVLEEATRARNEAATSYKEQYSELPAFVSGPDVIESDMVNSYLTSLKNQLTAIQKYKLTLDKLRKLGLDDTTYKKLLDEGTIDQQFASQLLAGGKTAVKNLNGLDIKLTKSAKALADTGARNLYQAGIDVSAGIVKGITSQQGNIAKAMEVIAGTLVNSIKTKLGIKSPSKQFAELAKLSIQGMINGFVNSSKQLSNSVDQVAENALTTMRNSISKYSFDDLIDMEPTITPIMDLSLIRKDATRLSDMIKTPIGTVSLDQASIISAKQIALKAEENMPNVNETSIRYVQNNYSPRELSPIEIYRQTRNQLSQLRSTAIPA